MQKQTSLSSSLKFFGPAEILAGGWLFAAILLAYLVTGFLQGSFPIFTVLMLVVALIVLIRKRDAARLGFRAIRWQDLANYTLINLAGSLALMAIFEPWSHTYQILFKEAVASAQPDTTFGWLTRFPGPRGWVGFGLYAGLVTLFAEEMFFRGLVLNWLKSRLSNWKAILFQATLFSLPQLLASFLLPPTQGILYAVIYSWLAIGFLGGWVASRTGAIWPSLLSAILYNLVMTGLSGAPFLPPGG